MRTRRRATRACHVLLAAALGVPGVGGCRTWQAVPIPRDGSPAPSAAHARLTRHDGRVDEVADARVEGDTMRAERYHSAPGPGRVAVAVPLDSVRDVEVRRVSWPRTLGLAAGVILVSLVLAPLAP